jgi:predicted house-cleaning noncanonical NTP pyrophosphatase (MazG superfamily)
MSAVYYNKLVRDNIPDIISSKGGVPHINILSNNDYISHLRIKLEEEFKEYITDHSVEELADIVEVVYAILDYMNVPIKDFEQIRCRKRAEKGAFAKKIFLQYVMNDTHCTEDSQMKILNSKGAE